MRISIDARTLFAHRTGIGRYLEGLLRALIQISSDHEYVLVTNHVSRYCLDGLGQVRLVGYGMPKPIWEQFSLPVALAREGADVYHIPHEGGPLVRGRWRFVVTIYDLIPFRFPELYVRNRAHGLYYRFKLETIKRRADAIITCSEATRDDLNMLLGIEPERIWLIPTPVDPGFAPMPETAVFETLGRLGVQRPYILAVGSAEPRKNLVRVLEAYSQLIGRQADAPRLILFGRDWRATRAADLVEAAGLSGTVQLIGAVDELELIALYSGATTFVYTSFIEGYGLPVLEAMACGCPVITSRVSSLPEAAGGAAVLVDPYQPEAIAEALTSLCQDEQLRDELRDRGLTRVRELSWEQTARRTLAVYEGAC